MQRIENTDSSIYKLMFVVHSSVIHNSHYSPLMDEWINKMGYVYAMEYYSALEKNDILTHAIAWMKLEDMLSEKFTHKRANII